MDPDGFVTRQTVNASYRPKGYEMSPGLKRARAPFRFRNIITGVTLAAFTAGVWAYSIHAVKQENFDDIDEEARALTGSGMKSIEDEERAKAARRVTTSSASGLKKAVDSSGASLQQPQGLPESGKTRGVLAPLPESFFPGDARSDSENTGLGRPSSSK